jgi:hypothetical protein
MAAGNIRSVMKGFKEAGRHPFMTRKQSSRTQRVYEEIQASPMATQLLRDGYPVAFAYRVVQLEKQKMSQGMEGQAASAGLVGQ